MNDKAESTGTKTDPDILILTRTLQVIVHHQAKTSAHLQAIAESAARTQEAVNLLTEIVAYHADLHAQLQESGDGEEKPAKPTLYFDGSKIGEMPASDAPE